MKITIKHKGGSFMSSDEEDELMERLERWDAKRAKRDFIHRMERKLNRKERVHRH